MAEIFQRKDRRGDDIKRFPILLTLILSAILPLMAKGAFSAPATAVADTASRMRHVLLINSYHKGFQWTDNVVRGIESVITARSDIELYTEYMDARRITKKSLFQHLYAYYASKFSQTKFDLIIASDNDALNFLVRYRDALFPRIPVVFCAIANFSVDMLEGKLLFTGVAEEFDVKATVDTALKLHPDAKELVAVVNDTPGGLARRQLFLDAAATAGKALQATVVTDPVLSEFEHSLKDKQRDTIVIHLGLFRDSADSTIPVEESTRRLALHNVPMYGIRDYYLPHGVIGGMMVSGFHQGEKAAQMALKVLDGTPVAELPLAGKDTNRYMFDYTQLLRFNLDPSLLPAGSILINRPVTVRSEPSSKVWPAVAGYALLMLVIILLAVIIVRQKWAMKRAARAAVGEKGVATEAPAPPEPLPGPRAIPFFRNDDLEALSLLAGGIAHDFNNLLFVIAGNVDLAKTGLGGNETALARLAEAEKAAFAAKNLTHQLLTFSRGGAAQMQVTAIGPLLRDVCRGISDHSSVKYDCALSDDLMPLEMDPAQIGLAIRNITLSLSEGMPQGTRITVSAENGSFTPPASVDGAVRPHVRITIEGGGNFANGANHKGTGGLGLAIAHNIIRKHGGHITVDSSSRSRTIVCVHLPSGPRDDEKGTMPQGPEEKVRKGKGRILIMDDAPAVRDVTGAMLTHMGYEVAFAEEGAVALDVYGSAYEQGAPFDAVILDLTVKGGMGAEPTLQALRDIDPSVRAIVSGAYSNDPLMLEFEKYGFWGALAKPYSMEELDEILKRLIK
jgi:signal transduction histidine kinase/CheY-like chemotaxis protein